MEKKDKPLKLFVIMFVLVLFFGITGSVLLRSYNERNHPERFEKKIDVIEDDYDKSFPQIINEPSRSVPVGETFTFAPRLAPTSDSTKLALLEAPEWLVLEGSIVNGVPEEKGIISFTLRIEKEGRYVDREFFLVVIESEDE